MPAPVPPYRLDVRQKMPFRILLMAIGAVCAVTPGHAQGVDVRGNTLTETLQSELEAELPDASRAETRFQAGRQADRAAQRLGDYLNSRGYFSATVEAGVDMGPPIRAYVDVAPGPQFTLDAFQVEYLGTPPAPETVSRIGEIVPLQPGDPITPADVIEAESRIVGQLRQAGHAFARAGTRQVVGDADAATVSVSYRIDAGALIVLGEVDYGPGLRTRRAPLERLVPFEPGATYRPGLLEEFNRRLGATRLYTVFNAQLAQTPSGTTPEGAAIHDVVLTLVERDRYTISAGGSYSTSEGIGANAEWTRRNFTRRGDTLRLGVVAAAQERSLEAEWRYPHAFGYGRNLEASASGRREETDAFDRETLVAAIGLDLETNPERTFAFAATSELSRETDVQGERDLQILSVSGAVRLDQTDSVLDPKSGWRADLRVEPGTVLGDEAANYISTVGQASAYRPFDRENRWVGALSMRTGFVFGADQLELPTSRRFFAGGGGSARGYAFQAIGPRADDGQPLGGRGLMEASAELRWRRSERLGFAAFMDGASVTARDVPTFSDMRFGAGLGVRYYTPVGPLRLDIAAPLDPRDGDDPVQLYISIGQAF